MLRRTLQLRTSPHLHSGRSVEAIMFNVAAALLPACLFAIYHFGLAALLVLVVAVATCLVSEHLICRLQARQSTVGDGSALVTGLLLAMTLPPSLPLWMVAVGSVVAIAVGKMLFGGLGANLFNPALVGRAFLQAAFPLAMTTWMAPPSDRLVVLPAAMFAWPLMRPAEPAGGVDGSATSTPLGQWLGAETDGLTTATPLGQWKSGGDPVPLADLYLGTIPGSLGESSALLIALGGLYLIARGMVNWRIPLALLGTTGAACVLLNPLLPGRDLDPLVMLGSGGLMLGAMFMATDMVASPMTSRGCLLYGALIGALVLVIRIWSGMPEGVMYAILLGNAASPLIDRCIQPRAFGSSTRRRSG